MNKIKMLKNGIALLMLMLVSVATVDTLYAKAALSVEPQQQKSLRQGARYSVEKVRGIDELWGGFSMFASEAHISDVTLGHDKKMSEPTEDFGPNDTIFAAVKIAENVKTVKVIGQLHIVKIAGMKAGPIPGIEVIVTLTREGIANFEFSKPTKGWPLGTYKFVALLVDGKGETIDTASHEFTVE